MKDKYHLILKGDLARIFLKFCDDNSKNKSRVVRRALRNYLVKEGILEGSDKEDEK